jgi:tetratricopeptide (TPR) repeat protein
MNEKSFLSTKAHLIGLAVAPLLIVCSRFVSPWSSLIAVVIAWIWFALPGYLVTFWISRKLSVAERIPMGFVLAVGISSPYVILGILFRIHLTTLISLSVITYYLSVIFLYFVYFKKKTSSAVDVEHAQATSSSQDTRWDFALLCLVLSVVVLLAFLSSQWIPAGDDISGLAIFSETLRADRITGTEPFHGSGTPSTPRNELIVWVHQNILVCKIANVSPSYLFLNSRPLFIVISFLAFYTLVHQFMTDRRKALFLMGLISIYMLGTLNVEGMGNDLITRIIQDKFFGWFVMLPVQLVLMHWYLQSRDGRCLLGFVIGSFGIAVLHPISLAILLILSASLGLAYLIVKPTGHTWRSTVIIGLALLGCLIIPVIQYLRYVGYFPIEEVGLREALEYARTNMAVFRDRLWLLESDHYILHPSIILTPVLLLGFLGLIPNWRWKRERLFTIFIACSLVIMTILYYFPPLAQLVGRFVTPYLLWRLAWPLPVFAILSIGLFLIHGSEKLLERQRLHLSILKKISIPQVLLVLLLLTAVISIYSISRGWTNLQGRMDSNSFSNCAIAEEAIAFLDQVSSDHPINVLASNRMNFCIPAGAAWANVVEFRGFGTINRLPIDQVEASLQRVLDVNYISTTTVVDELFMEIVNRYEIDYVLFEKERSELVMQLNHLVSFFKAAYSDQNIIIYKVESPSGSSPILEANTYLRLRQWGVAESIFTQILQEDDESLLALVGLAKTAQAQGQMEAANEKFMQALALYQNEPALYMYVGDLALLQRQVQKAVENYKAAISLDPDRSGTYYSLAQALVLSGEREDAYESIENSIAHLQPKGTASYFSELGKLLLQSGLQDEAVVALEQAIYLEPNSKNYVDLGNALIQIDEIEEAKNSYKRAMWADPWSHSPHLQMGILLVEEEELSQAVEKFERSWRLKPSHDLSFVKLGQSIKELVGIEKAIERLEDLTSLNSHIPGPASGLIPLYLEDGQHDAALNAFENNLRLQPLHAGLLSAEGYFLVALGMSDQAHAAYEEALLLSPDLISAHLGLSILHTRNLDIDSSLYHLNLISNSMPTASWPHILIAQASQYQGDWEKAEAELSWASSIDPESIQILIAVGDFYQQASRWDEASEMYKQVVQHDPGNLDALLRLALLYEHLGDLVKAEKYLEQAHLQAESDFIIAIKHAELLWALGQTQAAEKIFSEVSGEVNDSSYASIQIAKHFRMQGDLVRAAEYYWRAVQVDQAMGTEFAISHQVEEEPGRSQDFPELIIGTSAGATLPSGYASVTAGIFFENYGHYEEAENIYREALTFPQSPPEVYQALSGLLMKLGKWQEAENVLRAGVNSNPNLPESYYQLGLFERQCGELDAAIMELEKATEMTPFHAQAHVALAEIYVLRGQFDKAEDILLSSLPESQNSIDIYFSLATLLEKRGNFGAAENYYLEAKRRLPTDPRVWIALGKFYNRHGRTDEAVMLAQTAAPYVQQQQRFQLFWGDIYSSLGNSWRAIAHYQEAFDLDRSNVAPLIAMAKVHMSNGDFPSAEIKLKEALDLNRKDVDALVMLGKLSEAQGNFEQAMDYFQSAKEADLSRSEPVIAMSEVAKLQGDWTNALRYLSIAMDVSPTSLAPYISTAEIYRAMGETSQARQILDDAIFIGIETQKAFLARANHYAMVGMIDEASKDYHAAWSITPFDLQTTLEVAGHYRRYGQTEKSLEILEWFEDTFGPAPDILVEIGKTHAAQANWDASVAVLEGESSSAILTDSQTIGLAGVYRTLGQNEQAIDLYTSAIESGSSTPQLYLELAETYVTKLDYDAAYEVYSTILSMDPTAFDALLQVERIHTLVGVEEVNLKPHLEAAETAPTPSLFIFLAEIYQMRGEWIEARYWLDYSLDLFPVDSRTWHALSRHLSLIGDTQGALQAIEQSVQLSPANVEFLIFQGSLQEELGWIEDATATFTHALTLHPDKVDAYLGLANISIDAGEIDAAIKILNEAVQNVPASDKGYITLANVYLQAGDSEAAVDILDLGNTRIPGSSDILASLGNVTLESIIESSNALNYAERNMYLAEFMQRQYSLRVDNAETDRRRHLAEKKYWEAIANFEIAREHYELTKESFERSIMEAAKVRAHFEEALMLDGTNEFALLGLGKLEFALGNEDEGLQYYLESVDRNPSNTVSLNYLANGYMETDQPSEAILLFNRILELDPSDGSAEIGLYAAYESLPALTVKEASASVITGRYRWEYLLQQVRAH